jgi:hypothetical protein
MRTTLTLDPDVARLLNDEVHRQRKPLKQVVNDAIRRGLSPRARQRAPARIKVVPHRASLKPGLDPVGMNRLADELEDAALLAKAQRRRG